MTPNTAKWLRLIFVTISLLCLCPTFTYAQTEKPAVVAAMREAGVHPDDLALIEANIDQLSVEHLQEIQRFLTDPLVVADSRWFDVSGYASWDDYNFRRPVEDTVLTILARRDLFLDAARQLNQQSLTNMAPEALAALAFSQAYVEEKWDHEVPWDANPNSMFNWLDPDMIAAPNLLDFLQGDFLYLERTAYWWATYWSFPFGVFNLSKGTDMHAVLCDLRGANPNAPRLAGYSYPVGNQLYLQTAETAYWYADALRFGAARYGEFEVRDLDTRISFQAGSASITQSPPPSEVSPRDLGVSTAPEFEQHPGLWGLFTAPFAADLRVELTQPETASFWNVMRFVHASARQREGGASPEHPENGQPSIIALRYEERTPDPVGRATEDISAFALLTTVYSDSILLDFTNWNSAGNTLIHAPSDDSRSDGINRQVSERNKAVLVIEQMGYEVAYPNATHIAGSRGLDVNLTTQYDAPLDGDFLPYLPEEAYVLVMALSTEARDYGIESSRVTLCNSPLLRAGYAIYSQNTGTPDWATLVGDLCA